MRWHAGVVHSVAVLVCAAAVVASEERTGAVSPRAVAAVSGRDHDTAPIPRVRTLDVSIAATLDAAAAISPTLRHLLDEIARSDVIVYICTQPGLRDAIDGGLHFASISGDQRYLRIVIRPGLPPIAAAGVLAHELQHAAEVASASEVVNPDSLRLLYRRIGFPAGTERFETAAAQAAARKVQDELVSHRPRPRTLQ